MKAENEYMMVDPVVEEISDGGIYLVESATERMRPGIVMISSNENFPKGMKVLYDGVTARPNFLEFKDSKGVKYKYEVIKENQIVLSDL